MAEHVQDNQYASGPLGSPTGGAQEQVILPMSIAYRISVQGIRKRLGRSLVTVSGVALGVAFLMSVLSGVLIKDAVKDEAELRREIERRTVLLRGQIGSVRDKALLVVGQDLEPREQAFVKHLITTGGAKVATLGIDGVDGTVSPQTLGHPAAVVGLGDYAPLIASEQVAVPAAVPMLAYGEPSVALPETKLIVESLALRPEEIQEARERERQALYRVYWIVGASLLITMIGITNAMLMSVTERVREIGTLKCLGALSSFVVRLFLIESALVGLFGAVLGMLLGMAFAVAGYSYLFGLIRVLGSLNYGMLVLTALGAVVAGVILSIISGIYPARVAAKMIPASALASHV